MNIKEYERLYKQLEHYDDIERLTKKYDRELLMVVFTEKHVRGVKKKYHRLKAQARRLLKAWKNGESFVALADKYRFSPMMMAQILLSESGMTKRQVRSALRDYNTVVDARIRKELAHAKERDMVYSEEGARIQYDRGKDGEANIRQWLNARGMTFKEEAQLKGKTSHGKTVDFLLDKPMTVETEEGLKKIYWIESKGSFGDQKKIMRDYTKQLEPYTEIWGPGIVVYWFGFLEGMEFWLEARDVKVVRKEWFGQ